MSRVYNKSFVTNFLAIFVLVVGISFPWFINTKWWWLGIYIKNSGLFALSGAFTNWLAVFMLFEKVPLLYGSGVIPNNFEQFKSAIRIMIIDNFFTKENFNRLSLQSPQSEIDLEKIEPYINGDELFNALLESIAKSTFGPMINMLGGQKALETLRIPFTLILKEKIHKSIQKIDWHDLLASHTDYESMILKIESMIDTTLEEISPKQVKVLVEKMIKSHLGWLVVWGGVFGAVLGIISTIFLL